MLQGNNEADSLSKRNFWLRTSSHANGRLRQHNPSDGMKRRLREKRRRMRHIHFVGDGDVAR